MVELCWKLGQVDRCAEVAARADANQGFHLGGWFGAREQYRCAASLRSEVLADALHAFVGQLLVEQYGVVGGGAGHCERGPSIRGAIGDDPVLTHRADYGTR